MTMNRKRYQSPILMLSGGQDETEFGDGSWQGSYPPKMSYDDWLAEIAWKLGNVGDDGVNPDADYNNDGVVDETDFAWLEDFWANNP